MRESYKKIDPESVKKELETYISKWKLGVRINTIMKEVLVKYEGKSVSKRIITALKKALEDNGIDLWYISYENDDWMGGSFHIVINGKGNKKSTEYGRFYLDRGKTLGYFSYESFKKENYLERLPKWIEENENKIASIDADAAIWNKKVDEINSLLPMIEKYPSQFYVDR